MAEEALVVNGVTVAAWPSKANAARKIEGVVLYAADGSPLNGPSGVTPVSGSRTTAGNSLTFTPIVGRPFMFSQWGSPFPIGAVAYIESSVDGTTWIEETDFGVSVPLTAACRVQLVNPVDGITYRARLAAITSGTWEYEWRT